MMILSFYLLRVIATISRRRRDCVGWKKNGYYKTGYRKDGEEKDLTEIPVKVARNMEAGASSFSSPASASNGIIEHRVYARVGLLGNPSDVYYGRTISLSLGNFWATVQLHPSDDLVIKPHPTHDIVQFKSLDHLVSLSLSLPPPISLAYIQDCFLSTSIA